VVTSSVIDELGWPRKKAAVTMGAIIALVGLWPALDINALGAYDELTGKVMLPLGALGIAIVVGWVMKNPVDELVIGSSERMRTFFHGWLWILRVGAPVLLALVLWYTIPEAVRAFADLLG
jgi:SNF family Na+-dependent transporter